VVLVDFMYFLGLFLAFICGFVAAFVFNFAVENRARSLMRAEWGAQGQVKKKAQEDRITAAVAEFALLSKQEEYQKDGKPDLIKIGMFLLPKYPDIALRLGKEVGLNGLL
jgi:hypothetical protein